MLNRARSVRVGSKLCKNFGGKLYVGEITELPNKSGEIYYSVVYEDGDSETMKYAEVTKCIALFVKNNK